MRVHLGCDHAGLELKDHLTTWLTEHGHEPVDHGPFAYDAHDDYPVFCLRAAEGVVADRDAGLDSLGIVIGGSGNGEQMAANKVRGVPRRAGLVGGHRAARPRAQRRHGDLGRWADAQRRGDHPLRRGLPGHPVQRRRAARPADRPADDVRDDRRAARRRCLRATPSIGSRDELNAAFRGRRVRVGSPQGRFADSAALIDGQTLVGAEAWGKKLFVEFSGDRFVYVHLGLIGGFVVHREVSEVPLPVGEVRLRITTPTAYADLRGATACELVTREQRDAAVAKLGPDPLRVDADPDRAWERIRRSRLPIGRLLMDQSVLAGVGNVYRAELLFRHRMHPLRPGRTLRSGQWRAMWDDLVELMARGRAHRADRHGPARAHPGGDGPRRAGWTTTAERCMSIGVLDCPATSAADRCGQRCWTPETCSGARNVSPSSAPEP